MYKIINDKVIQKGNTFFPRVEGNRDYQQFKEDIVGIVNALTNYYDFQSKKNKPSIFLN